MSTFHDLAPPQHILASRFGGQGVIEALVISAPGAPGGSERREGEAQGRGPGSDVVGNPPRGGGTGGVNERVGRGGVDGGASGVGQRTQVQRQIMGGRSGGETDMKLERETGRQRQRQTQIQRESRQRGEREWGKRETNGEALRGRDSEADHGRVNQERDTQRETERDTETDSVIYIYHDHPPKYCHGLP